MGGQNYGSMANGFIANTAGVGALVLYLFTLVGVVMAGMGIYGFYKAQQSHQPGEMGKAATKLVVGIILAGGLMYFINSGTTTMGAGTSSTLQGIVNP